MGSRSGSSPGLGRGPGTGPRATSVEMNEGRWRVEAETRTSNVRPPADSSCVLAPRKKFAPGLPKVPAFSPSMLRASRVPRLAAPPHLTPSRRQRLPGRRLEKWPPGRQARAPAAELQVSTYTGAADPPPSPPPRGGRSSGGAPGSGSTEPSPGGKPRCASLAAAAGSLRFSLAVQGSHCGGVGGPQAAVRTYRRQAQLLPDSSP